MVKNFFTEFGYHAFTLLRIFQHIWERHFDLKAITRFVAGYYLSSYIIVAISSMLLGMVITIQFAIKMVTVFYAQDLIGNFVVTTMVREFIPILVCILTTGSIGAAITAELAAMKISGETNAMKVFRIDPVKFLLVPRFIALMIVIPMLVILGCYIACFSGQIYTTLRLGVPMKIFWDSAQVAISFEFIKVMLVKSYICSFVIGVIACTNGLAAEGGPHDVGRQTTKTVITSFISIFLINYILTIYFNI